MTRFVKCPTCQRPVEWAETSSFRPFCSERCRLIDLGAWFDERHTVAGGETSLDAPIEPRPAGK